MSDHIPAGHTPIAIATGEWAGPDQHYKNCTIPGTRHWGPNGAAGILPYTIQDGTVYVLLALRSPHVQQGGCWSTIGGALDECESPRDAATRELREEVSGCPDGTVTGSYAVPCGNGCGWRYTTILLQVPAGQGLPEVKVAKGESSWETDEVAWVPAHRLGNMKLHPGFRSSWPALRDGIASITRLPPEG